MEGLTGIARAQLRIIKNNIAGIQSQPIIKTLFISTFIVLFWVGALVIMYKGLWYFNRFPIVGPALVDEAIYLFFAALFIMLTLSSVIVCYVTYYNSPEVDYLFSKPVRDTVIFMYRFFQSVFFSSWAFLFLGVPFLLAYGLVKHVPLWFYLSIPCYFVPFILLPAALASITVLLFVKFIAHRRNKYILIAAFTMVVIVSYAYYMMYIRPELFAKSEIDYFLNDLLHHLSIFKYPLFPGYWMAKSVIHSGANDIGNGLFYFVAFSLTTVFSLQINWVLAEKTFYSGWLSSRGGRAKKSFPAHRGIVNNISKLFSFLPRFTTAMVVKDIKVFLRDPGQWFQFLIYFAILTIYILNLRNLPSSLNSATYDTYWKFIITFLNLSATALVLAGLTVRFLFPLMSLEGNKIWILGLAPITFRHILFEKFITSFVGILFISELLMISTNIMLRTKLSLMLVSCGLAVMISLGLVGLSVGLGSIYPNFKEDNSAKIVSGFGGTLNFIIALFYVIFTIASFAIPLFSYEVHHSITERTFYHMLVICGIANIIATMVIGIIPMILGYKQLESMEF
jgi:ABC-2 type transport system permease protein